MTERFQFYFQILISDIQWKLSKFKWHAKSDTRWCKVTCCSMWGSSSPRRCRSLTRRRPWCRAARGPGRDKTGRGRSSRRACQAGWLDPPPPAAARSRGTRQQAGMPGSGSWETQEVNIQTRLTMDCHRLNTCHPNLLENRANTKVCVDNANVVYAPNNSMNKDSQHCIVIGASTTE